MEPLPSSRSALLVLGLGLVFAVGCSSDPPQTVAPDATGDGADGDAFVPDPCKPSLSAGDAATVVVGEGQTFYRDIADDVTLAWEKGPQGGHHVWIALRQRGVRMHGTIITIDIEDVQDPASPVLVNHSRLVYDFDRDEGGYCTRTGLRMQLDNAGGPMLADLRGHRLKVTAKLDDPDADTATGVRYIYVDGTVD